MKRSVLCMVTASVALLFMSGCIQNVTPKPAEVGGRIEITGHHFGASQGDSYLSFTMIKAGLVEVRQVVSWSNRKIVLDLPESVGTGYLRLHRKVPLLGMRVSDPHYIEVQASGLPSEPYGYEVPVQAASPWPSFRRTRRNTGRSPIAAAWDGDEPWMYKTDRGIFSTPIIDGEGTVYIGSADHYFYALQPDGTLKWKLKTGDIIDSAGTITQHDESLGTSKIVFLSGDQNMYCIRADTGAVLWTFNSDVAPGPGYIHWWEGNVVMGYDGTLYAGNTNWNYYAVTQDGALRWTYTTGSNDWSAAAFADDGTIYWGSLDAKVHAVSSGGTAEWEHMTLGFIAASAAVGTDGTVYIGSFDSYLYALNPRNGRVLWKFPTNEHIYASVALGEDGEGRTNAIYAASADGSLYALTTDGELRWSYDTGDVIRSSPALGRAPVTDAQAENRDIVYFGCGNGSLYALNSDTGERRWSYDTTPDDPLLQDRNDLNSSPALGETGVYIGGEHGYVCYVPYDYCLNANDDRCNTDPGEPFPDNTEAMYYLTPGGSTEITASNPIPASTVLTSRLIVREDGATVNSMVCNKKVQCPCNPLTVSPTPSFDSTLQVSPDRHYVYMVPDGFLDPGEDLAVLYGGAYLTHGVKIGNLTLGGRKGGDFDNALSFQVSESEAPKVPLDVGADEVTAFEWMRLACSIPPMLPSLNQIGFDSYDWILGTLKITEPDENAEGRFLMWAVGGKRNDAGVLVPDPGTEFIFPLSGEYRNDFFILTNRSFSATITQIPITFDLIQLRGQLLENYQVMPGASFYAEAPCLSIPTYGVLMGLAGLCTDGFGKLLVYGTYLTDAYPEEGTANKRPDGISVASLDYTAPTRFKDGSISATFSLQGEATYAATDHVAGIVLYDAQTLVAVDANYLQNMTTAVDSNGNIAGVTLTLPRKTDIPQNTNAIVILDVFPLYEEAL